MARPGCRLCDRHDDFAHSTLKHRRLPLVDGFTIDEHERFAHAAHSTTTPAREDHRGDVVATQA